MAVTTYHLTITNELSCVDCQCGLRVAAFTKGMNRYMVTDNALTTGKRYEGMN